MESVSCRVCGIVAVEAGDDDAGGLRGIAQVLDRLVGLGLRGILHLHLQHQVAAAFQIEAEMDVLLQIRLELRERRGNTDAAENFGNPMMPNRQTSTVATITTVFIVRFRCMEYLPSADVDCASVILSLQGVPAC